MMYDEYEGIRRGPIVPYSLVILVPCNFLEGTNLFLVCSSLTFEHGEVT